MKKTALTFLAFVTLAFSVILAAQQQSSSQNKRTTAGEPDPAIISKLEQIVAIRDGQFKNYEVQLRAGRANVVDGTPEIELAEARIRLAQEKNQNDLVLAELKNLVGSLQRRLKHVQDLAIDRWTAGDLDKIKVALLEAEIRLLKAQK